MFLKIVVVAIYHAASQMNSSILRQYFIFNLYFKWLYNVKYWKVVIIYQGALIMIVKYAMIYNLESNI